MGVGCTVLRRSMGRRVLLTSISLCPPRTLADQYELIARTPTNQLRSFAIYCSVCKKEAAVRATRTGGANSGDAAAVKPTNGDDKLRALAKETLRERMHSLIEACNRAPQQPPQHPSPRQLDECAEEDASSDEQTASEQEEDEEEEGSPQHKAWRPQRLPQVDGGGDDEDDYFDVVENEAFGSNSGFDGEEREEYLKRPSLPMTAKRNGPVEARVPAWLVRIHLDPPPIYAGWLVEQVRLDHWNTPVSELSSSLFSTSTLVLDALYRTHCYISFQRYLAFSLLARLIARIANTPTTAREYIPLRRLLQWLTRAIETVFPWIPSTDSANEGRLLHIACALFKRQLSCTNVLGFEVPIGLAPISRHRSHRGCNCPPPTPRGGTGLHLVPGQTKSFLVIPYLCA